MLTEATLRHIEEVNFASDRPVIICDVDEVVVHFIKGLENYLERNGMWLHARSFALNGNVKNKSDDNPISDEDLSDHIIRFCDEDIHQLDAIDGAATTLNAMSEYAEVVMLTNLQAEYRAKRIANLAGHGLNFPVVTNSGPKGPAVKLLLEKHKAPAVFIDDIPSYLNSVGDHCPHVHLVHFMQDPRFARHADNVANASLRTGSWHNVHEHVLELIGA